MTYNVFSGTLNPTQSVSNCDDCRLISLDLKLKVNNMNNKNNDTKIYNAHM